jgi:hypothetical protein
MRLSLRMVLISLVAFVAIGGFISTIPNEPKTAPITENVRSGQCESGAGVSLVIDFGTSSAREVKEVCANDFESTGWALFSASGVKVEGTSEYPTGFVCRVDNWPIVEDQPCTKTPTAAQGSWVYFFADPQSADWQYSGQGAAMRRPICGAADGWRFVEAGEVVSQTFPRVQPMTSSCY